MYNVYKSDDSEKISWRVYALAHTYVRVSGGVCAHASAWVLRAVCVYVCVEYAFCSVLFFSLGTGSGLNLVAVAATPPNRA